MTDKQIINGIDVSQCECYSIEYNSCNDTLSGSCIKEKCQTFRLLQIIKAKEQECEELRGVIRKDICSHYVLGECSQKHHNNCVGRNQCIKDLEQECEELKREIDIRSCANIELSLEFKKYKKAIDEIEEIADNNYENPEMERIFKIIGGLDV